MAAVPSELDCCARHRHRNRGRYLRNFYFPGHHLRTLDYIAADADFVMSLNVRSILENAGCKKSGEGVELQGPLAKLMNLGGDESASFRQLLDPVSNLFSSLLTF